MKTIEEELTSPLNNRVLACPALGKWTSFQLVDEIGSGEPYAGLAYEVIDTQGISYTGKLDATGKGKIVNHCAGPIALILADDYRGSDSTYSTIQTRLHYPLKITELQVRAEQTRYVNDDGSRTSSNPAQASADAFYQVEVRHLVEHVSHLPPEVEGNYPPSVGAARLMREHGKRGVCLLSDQSSVLEVRPLRALRPLLSSSPEFCALNLYQMALMATLSYCPFGQDPDEQPVTTPAVSYPDQPSMGNWFGDELAKHKEIWRVDANQADAYFPLYEQVAYSQRLEIVPFDPVLYADNDPALGEDQENPANIHFLDDTKLSEESTDTQAFITHNDEIILIAIRGTSDFPDDALRDADAYQVPFAEGVGQAHRGFYEAAQKAAVFVIAYLDKFFAGQKLLICGHSLGGANALLLAEMLRRRQGFTYDIQLYTYGAPRAADSDFVAGAAELVHYRMVNHNDPVPSVPAPWMDTKTSVIVVGGIITFINVPAGLTVLALGVSNLSGAAYDHHGQLRHFMPVQFSANEKSSILWTPGCDTIAQHAACSVALQQKNGLPDRPGFARQLFSAADHSMVGSYIPNCWASLRRWQEAQTFGRSLVTDRELEWVDNALVNITLQLREARKEMIMRPDMSMQPNDPRQQALSHEIDLIKVSRERLTTLHAKRVSPADVYGAMSTQPEPLANSLARWNSHAENLVAEQLAMAPAPADSREYVSLLSDRRIGDPYILDIDSII
ncbi:lipase family protein [Pseudomonas sp. MS19]|uniref:lipase family protein n=1 Tax=Pseudomonas sp. MS19 TaxID=2579939 RepID=UPI001561B8C6|nr:lipase family protein [Pseudomonas sp. MS19]NRH29004.1 lipase family protein [Pseudomonas sp. MS19]